MSRSRITCVLDGNGRPLTGALDETVEILSTFGDFLYDSGSVGHVPGEPLPDTYAAREFLATWGPYMRGQYPGPQDPTP